MFEEFTDNLFSLLENEKSLADLLLREPPYVALGISRELLDLAYESAYKVFIEKKGEEPCSSLFFVLSILDPENDRYFLALGMSYQLEKNFEMAVDAYETAALLALDHPVPYFYLGKCLYLLGDHTAAAMAFELAIEYAEENPQMEALLAEAKEAYRLLTERKDK